MYRIHHWLLLATLTTLLMQNTYWQVVLIDKLIGMEEFQQSICRKCIIVGYWLIWWTTLMRTDSLPSYSCQLHHPIATSTRPFTPLLLLLGR